MEINPSPIGRHIPELDGIRGLAVLMVLIWHYFVCQPSNTITSNSPFFLPLNATWSGVDLFFVLSGFLIGGIIFQNHQKKGFLKVFWIKRACRILPLYLVVCLCCMFLKHLLDPNTFGWLFDGLMPFWSYFSFTQNFFMGARETYGGGFLSVTWSLAVEEQFYVFAPLAVLLFGKRAMALIAPLIAVSLALRWSFSGLETYVNTLFRMDALLLGVLVYIAVSTAPLFSALCRHRHWVIALFFGLMFLSFWAGCDSRLEKTKYFFVALFYAALILLCLLFRGSMFLSPFRSKALVFFGMISYGLYLLHQPVSGLLHGWLRNGSIPSLEYPDGLIVTISSLVVSIILSFLSYKMFESKFIALSKKLTY